MTQVVKIFQDSSCPDGFPMIFVLNDDSLVFTSEKRARHINMCQLGFASLVEEVYKRGLDNRETQRAIDEAHCDTKRADFGPVERMLYHLCMEGCADNLTEILR